MRTAVDWQSMTAERFRAQSNPYQPPIFLRGAINKDLPGMFSRVFGVDYFRYRAALQDIARRSLEAVEGATISTGFEDFESWFYDDTDEFIFPIDDDDLFAPGLARTIADAGEDTAVVVWTHVMAGFVRFEAVPRVMPREEPILFSNNWGVRKSFLRSEYDAEDAKKFLAQHHFAQGEAVRMLGISLEERPAGPMRIYAPLHHPRVAIHEDCYGLDYMHPGSLQFFASVAKGEDAEDKYRCYSLEPELTVPDCVSWAAPYLNEFRTVVPRLRGAC